MNTCWKTARNRRGAVEGAALLLLAAFLTWSQEAAATAKTAPSTVPALKTGKLLVATRQLSDPRFRETVILITNFGSTGTMGLIINRPFEFSLAHALPDVAELADSDDPLFFGGPVSPYALFVLVRSLRAHEMHHVLGNIYFGGGLSALQHIVSSLDADEAVRAYSGYSGWAAGQLEAEIMHGDWLVVPGDEAAIFDDNPAGIWEKLLKQWSGNWI